MRSRGSLALLCAIVLGQAGGCKSTMLPGEKYYIDSPGVGVAYLPRTEEQVHQAALLALRDDLGSTILSEDPLEARTDTGVNVRIELSPSADGETKMQISMDLDTPEMVIRGVMSKIEARLK